MNYGRQTITMLALAASCSIPAVCHAALGGTVDSIQSDRVKMHAASSAMRAQQRYTVHELTTGAGVTVREYAGSDGKVFAVTWSGPTKPDLKQLLGKYFEQYTSSPNRQHHGHRHAIVRDSDLVVQSNGHMRAFHGKAYLPGLMPQGTTPQELQ